MLARTPPRIRPRVAAPWPSLAFGLAVLVAAPAALLAGRSDGALDGVPSDSRLKTNVVQIDEALDDILRLRGVTFEYIDPASINERPGKHIGMIAQEVEQVFPDWVDEGADGYKRVTARGFEALTVEAFRDMRAENQRQLDLLRAELTDQIRRLREEFSRELAERDQRIRALDERVCSLERSIRSLQAAVR